MRLACFPHSLEAEMSVLGAILQSNEALLKCLELLQPAHLYRDAHRKIFAAAKELFQSGEPVDLITVTNRLRDSGELEEVGSAAYLTSLVDAVPTAANVTHHARIVLQKSRDRDAIKTAEELKRAALSGGDWQRHATLLEGLASTTQEGRIGRAPLVRANEIKAEAVSYAIEAILPQGMLTILSGRDKFGKTLLALEMVKAVLLRQPFLDAFAVDGGGPVAAYLLDDPDSLTIDRLKALGIYDHPDLHVCTASHADLGDAGAILEDMVAEVRRVGARFVVVDALYLFVPPGRESGNDVASMRPVMLALNRLAQETGPTVLLIAHDNKSGVDVAGSYIIRASAKAILRLSLPKSAIEDDADGPQTAYRVLRTETKMGPARSWTLEILGTPDKYEGWRCHGTTMEAQASETYRLVIACLEDKEPRTVAEIAAVIRRREQGVRDAVNKLVGKGKVEAIKGPPSGRRGRPTTRYQWRIFSPEEDFPSRGWEEKSASQPLESTQLAILADFSSRSSSPRGSERDEKSPAGLEEVEW